MIRIHAVADGVGPVERIVPRVENRRDRSRRETPFPHPPEEKEPEPPAAETEMPPPGAPEEDGDPRIDIHVLGLILPTRQLLPPSPLPATLH